MNTTTSISNIVMEFNGFRALNNVNLTINDGDFIAILGPSGCGKTTLLRLLAGFNKPTDGEIRIGDQIVANKEFVLPPNERSIGMVFQSYALWPHMKVRKNIEFPIMNGKFVTEEQKKHCEERVNELLDLVGLTGMGNRLPSQLSGGQRQRVALARALASYPKILLMDEPLSNLDTELRIEMRHEIKTLHEKTKSTIIYVTHDQSEALALATRIVVMNQGTVQQIGIPKEIFENPINPFVAKFVGRTNLIPGKWENEFFYPDNSESQWKGDIPSAFHEEGLYPVKPDMLKMSKEEKIGPPAIIKEVEYQGADTRTILELTCGELIEIRTKSIPLSQGEKVFVGL